MGRVLMRPAGTVGALLDELTAANFSKGFLSTSAGANTNYQVKALKDGSVANGLVVANPATGTAFVNPPGGTGLVTVDVQPQIISKIQVDRTAAFNAGAQKELSVQFLGDLQSETQGDQKRIVYGGVAGDIIFVDAMGPGRWGLDVQPISKIKSGDRVLRVVGGKWLYSYPIISSDTFTIVIENRANSLLNAFCWVVKKI